MVVVLPVVCSTLLLAAVRA